MYVCCVCMCLCEYDNQTSRSFISACVVASRAIGIVLLFDAYDNEYFHLHIK